MFWISEDIDAKVERGNQSCHERSFLPCTISHKYIHAIFIIHVLIHHLFTPLLTFTTSLTHSTSSNPLRGSASDNWAAESSSARDGRVGEDWVEHLPHPVEVGSWSGWFTTAANGRWDILSGDLVQKASDTLWGAWDGVVADVWAVGADTNEGVLTDMLVHAQEL